MSAAAILERLHRDGLQVRTDGSRVLLAPREKVTAQVLDLVRANKAALVQQLAIGSAQGPSSLVSCQSCSHFDFHPGELPEGYCRRYKTETWSAVPFTCTGHSPADPAARAFERRRRKVERELAEHPDKRVAADAADAPLRPEPGPPVSVVIAVRTAVGIVSGELSIPRERFDAALFFQTLDATAGRPS